MPGVMEKRVRIRYSPEPGPLGPGIDRLLFAILPV